jgi:antitoxin YefM
MYTIYRLNADELSVDFIESLQRLFPHKSIEIAVCEADAEDTGETAYLLSDPANRARLLEAIDNVKQQRNLVTVELDDFQ